MMSLQRNYYEVLGLPPGATTDQIKKKYRELARKFHPDVVQDKALGQRVFTQINQAYSVLGDPERRAQYNNTLQADAAPNTTSKPSVSAEQTAPGATPPKAAAASAPAAPSQPLNASKAQSITEMMGKAENAIMSGKPIEARAFCMRVLEADPRHVRALEILGDALVQMGRRDEAAVQYRRALQVSPSTLIQAKLNRIAQAAPSAPPPAARPAAKAPASNGKSTSSGPAQSNGNGVHRTTPPAAAETEKSGGLLGRLLGRK